LDATEMVTEQDKRVAGIPHEAGRGVVLAGNKWDLVEKYSTTADQFKARLGKELPFLSYAPVVFISALTGQRLGRLLEMVTIAAGNHAMRISTGRLNHWLQQSVGRQQPPSSKGVQGRIYFASQVA